MAASSSNKCNTSFKENTWRWPWVVVNVALYAFCLPWMADAIFRRYYVDRDFDSTLPGLDDTFARAFFMAGHMLLGAICLILYPLQFIGAVRRKFPRFHRWNGRISCISAVLTSIFGTVFIFLKRFVLVGGINMGLAFFTAGLVFGGCAVMAGWYARKGEYVYHRFWAIRSYSQILAPMMYRYWYLVLGGFNIASYEPSEDGLGCDENDVCDAFLRAFDAVHAWTYWIFPLLVAEVIVYLLKQQNKQKEQGNTATNVANEEMQNEEGAIASDKDVESSTDEELKKTQSDKRIVNHTALNLFALLSAAVYAGATIFIYVTSILGKNAVAV